MVKLFSGRFFPCLLLCAAVFCGCSRKVYVPLERVVSLRDSVNETRRVSDTLVLRDSVIVSRNGDTLLKEA